MNFTFNDSQTISPNFPPSPLILLMASVSKSFVVSCSGSTVCLFGLLMPHASLARILL